MTNEHIIYDVSYDLITIYDLITAQFTTQSQHSRSTKCCQDMLVAARFRSDLEGNFLEGGKVWVPGAPINTCSTFRLLLHTAGRAGRETTVVPKASGVDSCAVWCWKYYKIIRNKLTCIPWKCFVSILRRRMSLRSLTILNFVYTKSMFSRGCMQILDIMKTWHSILSSATDATNLGSRTVPAANGEVDLGNCCSSTRDKRLRFWNCNNQSHSSNLSFSLLIIISHLTSLTF